MNKVEIPERDLLVEYASDWEELTNEQFAFTMKQWLKLVDQQINEVEFKTLVLYHLLGIKRSPFQDWKDKRISKTELEQKFSNIYMLTETLDWMLTLEDGKESLSWRGVRNYFKEIDCGSVTLKGLQDGMLNIKFKDYRMAWTYNQALQRSYNEKMLDALIGCLYKSAETRKKDLRDGIPHPGPLPKGEGEGAAISKLPTWQKMAIWIWFNNCDRFLKEDEMELNGKPICFAPLFTDLFSTDDEEVETLGETDFGLTGLHFMIGESQLFGSLKEVDDTDYIDILTALLYWKERADKMKRKAS